MELHLFALQVEQVSLGLIIERLHMVCLRPARLLSVPLLRWPFGPSRYGGSTWRYGCDDDGIFLLSPVLSKEICSSETLGASSRKAYAFHSLGLSSHILMDGDVVEGHGCPPLPKYLGFAHSSIPLDFRIHKRASKHPWLCFGSFWDVLIQFKSPWQARARSHVLLVLNQPRVFGRRLEVAGQGKAGRSP